jgi:hypothetical protein
MAEDKRISELTPIPNVTGLGEVATTRNGSSYKMTINQIKSFVETMNGNIEGGNAFSIYVADQLIDGGNAINQ